MMFVVGQVGIGTQANSKQAAMLLSLRKDNLRSQMDRTSRQARLDFMSLLKVAHAKKNLSAWALIQ
jgi:hypothetical protein